MNRQDVKRTFLLHYFSESYNSRAGDAYRMPENLIAVGQVCAALFPEDSNWHRAVITQIVNEDYIKCYYVDYGSSCSVHKKCLRLLK